MLFFTNIIGTEIPIKSYKVDDTLIHLIGADNHEAFKTLYDNINEPLFAFILSLTQNVQDAEDILQETYLKIRSAAHLYKPMGKPMAWIFTIARNLTRMHHRQAKRTDETEIDQLDDNLRFSAQFDNEDQILLQQVLTQLNEKERTIILLHSISGYKHREIARDLDMPLSTVQSIYNRGLKKLKALIETQKAGSK